MSVRYDPANNQADMVICTWQYGPVFCGLRVTLNFRLTRLTPDGKSQALTNMTLLSKDFDLVSFHSMGSE